jgi:hypothetical protein
MKSWPIIGIVGGIIITIAILGVVFAFNQESDIIEVEEVFNKEIDPIENPEIEEKLNEIEKTANENYYKPTSPIEWITSGPFQIDRGTYDIGQKIFIRIGGLQIEEKGQIAIMMPLNTTHHKVYTTIPFDGTQKSTFNYYLEPQINSKRGICSVDDLTGKWIIMFRGTNYPSLEFEVTEKVVPSTNIETVC